VLVLLSPVPGSAEAPPFTPEIRAAIVDSALAALNEEYIFPSKAEEMDRQIRTKLKAGEYDDLHALAEFLQILRRDLTAISNDRHIALWVMRPEERARQEQDEREEMRSTNHGFRKMEILPGDVGYLDLRIFDSPKPAAPTAMAAMSFFANVDALIIDLRYNGGGDGDMVAFLLSYFYEDNPIHHIDTRFRDRIEQTWTPPYVSDVDLSRVPLYVLTSGGTFSAAEDFAYGLKTRKRATIIGETTRGGAHPITYRYFEELNVEMMIPNAESASPLTGENWEGTGVNPDIEVPEVRALSRAYQEALGSLVEGEQDQEKRKRLERALRRAAAEAEPVSLDSEQLGALAGTYGGIRIQLDEGHLYWQRDERSRYRLIPVTRDWFRLEGGWAELEFNRDATGRVTGVVRKFRDGSSDTNSRTTEENTPPR